jgi:choline dehydrogenase-like flavoprotein
LGRFDYLRDIGQGLEDSDFLLDGTPVESAPLRLSRGPLRFGEAYRDDLERSENIDLQLYSNAIGFFLADDDRITGVEVASLDGERRVVEGRAIVLAAGAVENARILMLANASHGRRFGDAGGLLGKCYLDHPTSGAGWITFSQSVSTRAYWRNDLKADDGTLLRYVWRLSEDVLRDEGLVNAHFYLIPMSGDPAAHQRRTEARQADRALRNIAKWAIGRSDDDYRLSEEYCAFITKADSFAAETWTQVVHGERTDRILLKFESEELPSPHNRVSLSDERDTFGRPLPVLHWAPGDTERASMIRTAMLIGRICGQQDLGRLEFEDFDRPYWGTTTSWHQLGTTRMATSPREGVVDADARVHGTRNLFVASGSVMPTGGRANPTMTIVALTIRLADHLKQEITAL